MLHLINETLHAVSTKIRLFRFQFENNDRLLNEYATSASRCEKNRSYQGVPRVWVCRLVAGLCSEAVMQHLSSRPSMSTGTAAGTVTTASLTSATSQIVGQNGAVWGDNERDAHVFILDSKDQWRRYTGARQVKWPGWKIHCPGSALPIASLR